MAELTLMITFVAGLLSFSTPCVLPLVPGFLSYLVGTSLSDSRFKRKRILINAVFFLLGLSLIFTTLGVVLNSIFSAVGFEIQVWLSRVGGTAVIIFALDLAGLVHLPVLGGRYGFTTTSTIRPQFVRSFVLGSAFALGWTPCVGPVLGAVLGLAMVEPASAFSLLSAYSLSLGIPFLIGPLTADVLHLFRGHARLINDLRRIFGSLLIIVGILAFTQNLGILGTPVVPNTPG
jgi:cytochrome c-type biogenesis protein